MSADAGFNDAWARQSVGGPPVLPGQPYYVLRNYMPAYGDLALLYAEQGDLAAARAKLAEGLARSPNDAHLKSVQRQLSR